MKAIQTLVTAVLIVVIAINRQLSDLFSNKYNFNAPGIL